MADSTIAHTAKTDRYTLRVQRDIVRDLGGNLIDPISFDLNDVFAVILNNRTISQQFVAKGFISNREKTNELNPFEERVMEWSQRFVQLIRSRSEQTLLNCLVTLCDPIETDSQDYSHEIRRILNDVKGVTVEESVTLR